MKRNRRAVPTMTSCAEKRGDLRVLSGKEGMPPLFVAQS